MIVVQPQLDVPAKIAAGIACGKFTRIGSVVRDASSGRIVTFLNEASGGEKSQEAMARAAALLKSRGGIVATAAVGTVAAAATAFVVVKKRKQASEPDVPECLATFNALLRAYLDAGREGSLDASIVDQLISDLDEVKAYSENTSVAVDFSTELWVSLLNLVVDHTCKLAEAYSVEMDEPEEQAAAAEDGVVVDLRRHLEVQRQILAEAA